MDGAGGVQKRLQFVMTADSVARSCASCCISQKRCLPVIWHAFLTWQFHRRRGRNVFSALSGEHLKRKFIDGPNLTRVGSGTTLGTDNGLALERLQTQIPR